MSYSQNAFVFFVLLFLIYFFFSCFGVTFTVLSCDLSPWVRLRSSISTALVRNRNSQTMKRKALTLDAIFFKDELFFLNVAFIAL